MPWLDKKKNWLPGADRKARGSKLKAERKPETFYSVTEVARIMSVHRDTVFKWLSIDDPDNAVIPPDGWIKLRGCGYIRIRESAVLELQKNVN